MPPACSTVSTTSAADRPLSCMSTGMPRPSSTTVTEPSMWIVTSTLRAEPGQRFVDRVVDDLVDEVVQARTGPVDPMYIAGPLPDGFEAFEDFDFVGAVVVGAAGRNRARRRACLARTC